MKDFICNVAIGTVLLLAGFAFAFVFLYPKEPNTGDVALYALCVSLGFFVVDRKRKDSPQ